MPLPGSLARSERDTLTFASHNLAAGSRGGGSAFLRFEIGADGTLSGVYEGVDPPDSDGEGGGRFAIAITGAKLRDMAIPPKAQ